MRRNRGNRMRAIIVYDRQGREIKLPSIARMARETGLHRTAIARRLNDGGWIRREGYVPVRVREG